MTEDEELELELELAKATSSAKKKKASAPPDNMEVARQAAIKGPAGMLDAIGTGFTVAPKMLFGAGATALGRPDLAPNIEGPVTGVTDFFTNNENVPESLRLNPEAVQNMTPEQEILDATVEGIATGGVGRGKKLINMALSGAGAGAGEAVSQWADDPVLGLAASMAAPILAGKAIPQLNAERNIVQIQNSIRDRTYEDARKLGLVAVPDTKLAEFADRDELIRATADINQRVTDDIARSAIGVPRDTPLDDKLLERIRLAEYNAGYKPLEGLGTNPVFVDPATGNVPFLDDLIALQQRYTGTGNTFPDAVPKQLNKLFTTYLQGTLNSKDVVETIKRLRHEAGSVLGKNDPNPKDEEIAYAKKAIADAFENELERQAIRSGVDSKAVENYRKARKQIAISYTVGEAMERGSGNISGKKLAKKYQKGDYMDGPLAKVAAFYNVNHPRGRDPNQLVGAYFRHAAGFTAAGAAGMAMGLPTGANAIVAVAGALGINLVEGGMKAAARKFITSPMGQSKVIPDYTGLGVGPQVPATAGIGYFSSMQESEEE